MARSATFGALKQPPPDLAQRLWDVSDEFLELGSDVKVDDLAELSGVPRATIYYYFSGKEDVLAFLLAEKVRRASEVVAQTAAGPGTPAERLGSVVRAMLHLMAEHPALCTRLMCWMSSGGREAGIIDAQGSLMAPVRELLVEGQATGELSAADPTEASAAIMGTVSMVALHHTVHGGFDPDAVADRVVRQLLDGLKTARGRPSSTGRARR